MSHLLGVKSRQAIPTAIAGTAFLLLTFAPASWADNEADWKSLRGIRGVEVLVENLNSDVERDGLSRDQIKTEVELRLRQSRIPVLTLEESARTPGSPYLYVNVSTFRSPSDIYAFHIHVGVWQKVILLRQPTKGSLVAETWHAAEIIGASGTAKVREIRQSVLDRVDEFINAFLAVNPR